MNTHQKLLAACGYWMDKLRKRADDRKKAGYSTIQMSTSDVGIASPFIHYDPRSGICYFEGLTIMEVPMLVNTDGWEDLSTWKNEKASKNAVGVSRIDPNTNDCKEFGTIKSAAASIGVASSSLMPNLNTGEPYRGYIWERE